MSNNIRNIDITLQEIVKNTAKDLYTIPKFQRDFVWASKDIIDLGDSIIRGYPISSLLLMPENGNLKVEAHSLIKDDSFLSLESNKAEETETKFYILDGQQRMTSIAKLFLACDAKNEYYYDLLAILMNQFPNDKIENDSGLKLDNPRTRHASVDNLCHSFVRSTSDKSDKPTRSDNRFISGKSIIDNKFGSVINKFLNTLQEVSDENKDKYTDYLNAILGSVSSYSIPATSIASDSELGVVIRVFEKVNSTGKKLTLFDLINAKSYQVNIDAYSGGLSTFLTNRLNQAIHKEPSLTNALHTYFKFNEDTERYEKLDRIVRILEVTRLLKISSIPSLIQATMLNHDPHIWFEMWVEHENNLLKVLKWVADQQLLDIGQITFIEYIAAVFLAQPEVLEKASFKIEVKKYALHLALTSASFSKSNLDIVEKFYSLAQKICNSHEYDKLSYEKMCSNPNLTGKRVLEFTTAKAEFRAVLNILYKEKPEGKFDRDIFGHQITNTNVDLHHIYPKSRVDNFSSKCEFNSIANIIYIEADANRAIIKDKTPDEYFKSISNTTLSNLDFHCEHNLINFKEISHVHSQNEALMFITERATKIANIVNTYFQ